MSQIVVACTHCGNEFRAGADTVGRTFLCPGCGESFVATNRDALPPLEPLAPGPLDDDPLGDALSMAAGSPTVQQPAMRKRRKHGKRELPSPAILIAVGGGGLLVLLLLVFVVIRLTTGGSEPEIEPAVAENTSTDAGPSAALPVDTAPSVNYSQLRDPPHGWTNFVSFTGGYEVYVPHVRMAQETLPTEFCNGSGTLFRCIDETGKTSFSVGHVDINVTRAVPRKYPELLDAVKLDSPTRRNLTVAGQPAREYDLKVSWNATGKARVIQVDNRLCYLEVMQLDGGSMPQEKARQFFDSFQIGTAATIPPPGVTDNYVIAHPRPTGGAVAGYALLNLWTTCGCPIMVILFVLAFRWLQN